MPREQVYARILVRVDREELDATCRDAAQREATLMERRVRSAQRALQHVYDVEAARTKLPELAHLSSAASTAALLKDVQVIQSTIALRMKQLAALVSNESDMKDGESASTDELAATTKPEPEPTPEQEPPLQHEQEEAQSPLVQRKRNRQRPRQYLNDSPRKPPRPGRLALVGDEESTEEEEDEAFPTPSHRSSVGGPRGGPHEMPSAMDDEETEDDLPMELDVLDSDTEFETASYLEKARRLRKISSERRMGELPALIKAVLAAIDHHDWTNMPRELLGTLSATMGASTTLKSTQRTQLKPELLALRTIALLIDETTGRRYPTLLGSTARFLSSMHGILGDTDAVPPTVQDTTTNDTMPDVHSALIEELHAATTALSQRADTYLKSMEQIDELLTLVDHVFDNPTLARSHRYSAMVAASLGVLIAYVDAIPRTTRRSLQCHESLQRRRAQLTGLEV